MLEGRKVRKASTLVHLHLFIYCIMHYFSTSNITFKFREYSDFNVSVLRVNAHSSVERGLNASRCFPFRVPHTMLSYFFYQTEIR